MGKSKLPVKTLDEIAAYLEDIYNNLTSGDMPDNEGICFRVARYLNFLKELRAIYWQCPSCNRLIAPDEEYATINEVTYCKKCSEEL